MLNVANFDTRTLPEAIRQRIDGLTYMADSLGRSGDTVILFENHLTLKISPDKERLAREKEKLDWLSGRIPCAQSVLFCVEGDLAYFLRTCVEGDSLTNARFLRNPALLVELLGKAISLLRALDGAHCPFSSTDNAGDGFVHGDLCLPNILIGTDNEIAGFIDLDNAGRGDPWYDYAWALWSLAYNLKTPDYGAALLARIGVSFSEEKYNRYIPAEYRT